MPEKIVGKVAIHIKGKDGVVDQFVLQSARATNVILQSQGIVIQ